MKVRNRILSFALPLTVVPFVLTAFAVYYFVIRADQIQQEEEERNLLAEAIVSLRKEQEGARRDLELIAELPAIGAYLEGAANRSRGQERVREKSEVQTVLELFALQNAYCLQLSLVDSHGQERIKFSKLPGDNRLESLKGRDYFRRTLIHGSFQSPVEEVRPGRFASVITQRVWRSGFLGAVVLHFNADVFQSSMRPLLVDHSLSTFLFDDRGIIFSKALAGGAEEACINQINLASEASSLLSAHSPQIRAREIASGDNTFFFSVLPAEAFIRSIFEPQSGENWFLGVLRPTPAAAERMLVFQIAFFSTLIAAVAAVIWAATRYSRKLTVPLERVAGATARIAAGDFDISLEIDTRDEVQDLARAVTRMAEDLRKYQAELVRSARLATIGEMTSEISHEIQNRISGISLWLQYLDAEVTAGDPRQEYVKEMKQGLGGFNGLLEDLKQFYKTPILHLSVIDVNDLIRDSLPVVEQRLIDRRIKLEVSLDPKLPAIECDAEKIKSVILNLIVNATDAVGDGGNIEVRTFSVENGAGPADRNGINLMVRDDGCGIAEQDLARIFYPFYSTKHSGGGLGLAITSNIVTAHRGRIEVESKPGGGATFVVTLPNSSSA